MLGSGTSQGVPVISCDCDVCSSRNTKDKRLRSSIMITFNEKNYVVDTGPDFRQQMLREGVRRLDGVLFTHEHKDHISGLDDVRAFNYRTQAAIAVYCTDRVEVALRREYHYVFAQERYPGIPEIELNRIENKTFAIDELVIQPIEVFHYKLPVLGFRIGAFVYITDAKTVTNQEREKVRGADVLVINALHRSKHISHFNLEEALEFIADVKPKKAYLTHISHLFGKHDDIEKELPEGVYLAYDGLQFDVG